MSGDFSKNLIKKYKYWEVYIHENQGYLGRSIIWCVREDALDLTDATKEEQEELFLVLKDLIMASKKAFNPSWFNYAFLGNETRHLHCHFISRYEKPVIFMNTAFEDKLYGHNYKTDHGFVTTDEVLFAIREKLKEAINSK